MRRFSAVMGWRVVAGALVLGTAIAGANSGQAEPFDKDVCAKLATERQSLANMGVEQNMAKGPQWASTNLPPSGLDLIKRYITVDEQIKFRCRAAPVAAAAPASEEKPKKRVLARKAHLARTLPAKAKAAAAAPHKAKAHGAKPASASQKPAAKAAATVNARVN